MLKPRPDVALSSGFSDGKTAGGTVSAAANATANATNVNTAPVSTSGATAGPADRPFERTIMESAQRLASEVQGLAARRAQIITMLEEHDRAIMQKQAALEALKGVLAALAQPSAQPSRVL
jgi:hypothetical protein